MTVYIDPNCPPEIDALIRAEARARGERVFPKRLPWNRLAADQRTIAERKWQAPTKARKPQAACDVGLFSDDARQIDLEDLLR